MQKIIFSFFVFTTMLLLQSCMDVATSGAQVVYNRRALENTLSDQYITMQAFQKIHYKTDDFKNANVVVSTYHQELLLAGQVPEAWQKDKAGVMVNDIPDVKEIYNLITVEHPSSTLTRMSDAWITAKIKAKFLASNDLDSSEIKVVTENGTVFLMGVLPASDADAAVELARETDGVLGVVKIFSYVTISKKSGTQA